jgi:hypothetical protein
MTHTSPHPDEIRYFSSRLPHDSYATVKRAMRHGYKYPLRISWDETARLLELNDATINTADIFPTRVDTRMPALPSQHSQITLQGWETVWFRDVEIFTYVKMMT